jgi:phosphoribosylaminoimidazolecarboxamide formyltransferase / IMP cyclohydrolase
MTDLQPIKRALFSVSDKDGMIGFARFLSERGVEIIATGGTAKKLEEAGITITPIESITGNPEAFGGRMKTISFPFVSALLYRRDHAEDLATAKQLNIRPIDLVVCNLYPFAEARKKKASEPELIEEIDVGGPTMIRAAAKNHNWVAVCSHPSQYAEVMAEIEAQDGALSLATRKALAAAAFRLTAQYDAMIAEELNHRFLGEDLRFIGLVGGQKLRYGENPHQAATFYRTHELSGEEKVSIAGANILQGKALSYNNLLDADAAHRSASDAFHAVGGKLPTVSIIKHLNPCGLASARTSMEALTLAWAGDPVSAFGGILCFTHEVDLECAKWLEDKFIEVLVAPAIASDALALFAKKKNLRVLITPPRSLAKGEQMIRSVSGGLLLQDEDIGLDTDIRPVTKKTLPDEIKALVPFGIMATKHLRSNAIALVAKHKNGSFQLVGAGMGQPNRIDSLRLLAAPRAQAKQKLSELLLVSDAFFPFADTIDACHELGIQFIVQPGGSIRDEEVIQAADKYGMSMVFTGTRHFRH